MKRNGRPFKGDGEITQSIQKTMPKEETESHRQMKAYFLSKPLGERSYSDTARKFNRSLSTVIRAANSFNWKKEAKKLDAEDPFIKKYKIALEDSREKLFKLACAFLDIELIRAGVSEKMPKEVESKINEGDIEGATKECIALVKAIQVKGKDYKDMLNLVELFKKVGYEWNPPDNDKSANITTTYNLNKYNLHIPERQ